MAVWLKITLFTLVFASYMVWNVYVLAKADRYAREIEARLKADKQKH
jgi:hypothetical protein